MALKFPPPVWWLLCALVMFSGAHIPFPLSLPSLPVLALLLLILGGSISLAGVWSFHNANTTVHPQHPQHTRQIVQEGLYRYSRNPMYLGMLIALIAWGIYLGHLLVWVGPPLFAILITRYQILPEERILAEKFGEPYRQYCLRVRRWI